MKNSKWKKSISTLIIGLSLSLVACGANQGEESENGGSDDQAELTYSIWDQGQKPGMTAIADAFNEQNPDINVNVEVTPWDQFWTKMESAAQGESMPDIFWMHSNEIAKYTEGQILMDLSEEIETSEKMDIKNFPEELVELYSTDDQILGVPKDYDTVGLWYNKELFDKAGVDYPDETWDWDDLLSVAEELTDEEAGVYGFVTEPGELQQGYHNFIYQNGGEVLSDDKKESGFRDAATIEAVQWYADLSLKHGVTPTVEELQDNDMVATFQAGRGAMAFLGTWQTAQLEENEYTNEHADVAVLPKGKEQATIINGLANSVSAKTKYPEEALRFLEFLSSEEGMKIQGENGSAIPALNGSDVSFIEAYPQFNVEAFIDQKEYGHIKPYTKYTARWEDAEKQAMIPVFNGEKTVEEISEKLIEDVEEILQSE